MSTVANRDGRSDARAQEQTRPAQNFVSPEVNIFETKDGYILEAEIPGVSKEGLDITLEGNELTIVGRREKVELNAQALYRESTTADYRRVFELDPAVDTGAIDAKVDQGVLTVRLPKSERVKPRKVTVND
ncbi:MAG: hspA 2 [Pedosphaera sp.]|nr:hspA 2 [Pedosphaera sp.]